MDSSDGEWIASFGLTEAEGGSDPAGLTTAAVPVKGEGEAGGVPRAPDADAYHAGPVCPQPRLR